jgi:predicted O-methyltransferase YrrM
MEARMRHLERIDAADRTDGTPQRARLRQVPEVTGRYLAMIAACSPIGKVIEIGTSAGYSAMWISLACKEKGATLTTFEVSADKVRVARETFEAAGLEMMAQVVEGDARDYLPAYNDVGFCFLDAEKDVYTDCYKLIIPRLVRGGLLVADNVISHRDALQSFMNVALADDRVDSLVVPIGNGLLTCRRNMLR